MSIADTDLVEVLRDGVSYKATGSQINDYLTPSGYQIQNSIDFGKGSGTMSSNTTSREFYTTERDYHSNKMKDVAMSFWIKPASVNSDQWLYSAYNEFGADENIQIGVRSNGVFTAQFGGSTSSTYGNFITKNGWIKANVWQHVFFRWSHYEMTRTDGANDTERFAAIEIWIDGVKLSLSDMAQCGPGLDCGSSRPAYAFNMANGSSSPDTSYNAEYLCVGGQMEGRSRLMTAKIAEYCIVTLPDALCWSNIKTPNWANLPDVHQFGKFNGEGKWVAIDPLESTQIKWKDANPAKSPIVWYLDFKDANALWKSPATDFDFVNTGSIATGVDSSYQSTDTPTSI